MYHIAVKMKCPILLASKRAANHSVSDITPHALFLGGLYITLSLARLQYSNFGPTVAAVYSYSLKIIWLT